MYVYIKLPLSTFLMLVWPLFAAQLVLAENAPFLEEIVVTATKSRVSAFALPYAVSQLGQHELARSAARNLPEALSELPGVMIQKTANGHGSPYIRGFTGYRTLAIIDGVRYNNSVYRDGANEYFSLIDSYSISKVELLSGPASALYGSDAIGGSINLKTHSALNYNFGEGVSYLRGKQLYRYASAENSQVSRTEIGFGKGHQWGILAGLSAKRFGDVDSAQIGRQRHTGYDEKAFDVRFDVQINEQWKLNTLHQTLQQKDVWRTHSTIYAKPFAGTLAGDDLVRLKDQKRQLSYVKLLGEGLAEMTNGIFDEVQLTLSQQYWDEDGYRVKSDESFIKDYFDSSMSGLDLQFNKWGRRVNWSYGLDYYSDKVDSGRNDFLAGGTLQEIRIQGPVGDDARYELLGLYWQMEFQVATSLNVNLASRYTDTHVSIGAYEDPESGMVAAFGGSWNQIVNSVRATYLFDKNFAWRLWGGVSQSFRAPNIADLSRYGKSRTNELEIAATDLAAENFLTYEIGVKSQAANYQMTASYYYTNIKDYITSVPTGKFIDGQVVVSKSNSSGGYVQGVELGLSRKINREWQVFTNVTWLEGTLDVFQNQNQNQSHRKRVTEPFSRIMPFTSVVGFNWEHPENNTWLRLSIVRAEKADKLSGGDRLDLQRIPFDGTPAYTLVNFWAGGQLNEKVELNVSVQNLLNEAYRSHGSGVNEPGRGLVISLQANL